MANIKSDLDLVIKWLAAAIKKVKAIMAETSDQTAKNQRVGELLGDIQSVISAHIQVLKVFVPERPITPFPKNFISRLTWIASNMSWFNVLGALTSGQNPFEDAKAQAKTVATKWGFYTEVYGA